MIKEKILGMALILISFLIISLNISLTGAIIGSFRSDYPSIMALAIFIVGIILFLEENRLERNLASDILKKGGVITDPKEIIHIAVKSGYHGREVKEGYEVLDKYGKPLTVIPHRHISKGVSKEIIKTLATGKSKFKERRYMHTKNHS